MSPDDVRHGSQAGYLAHRRSGEPSCEPCIIGRRRAAKQVAVARQRGVQLLYSPAEIEAVINPWVSMGMSYGSITSAAGLGSQYSGRIYETLRGQNRGARRATYAALAAVTEHSFSPNAKVYADLTRRRVNSLMAAGHELSTMPIALTGQWRYRSHISVRMARDVRAFFRLNEFTIGPSDYTSTRAKNAGHRPPLAWDDPDTLAWPTLQRSDESPWEASADRSDLLAELDQMRLGITEACRRLDLSRRTLEKWCHRHGHTALYSRLVDRDTPRYWRNAAAEGGAA